MPYTVSTGNVKVDADGIAQHARVLCIDEEWLMSLNSLYPEVRLSWL